ncbi:unnamed protein product [Notodromas monacha]|uniref:non-specific serine/threonine protein kinase n=1 Tax=Notodromas monacha TaxID=399045 RepID=A0A7R9BLN6_9CRUS|nr:unnamed protein product [Notodromas monacha]CAG0917773.1 unnamed protein product [Notodromas monacha]
MISFVFSCVVRCIQLFYRYTVKMFGCCGKSLIRVNGRNFTIKETIGEGGFSTVYLVEDKKSKSLYAIKETVCHSDGDEKAAVDEARILERFDHPNIVKCVDYGVLGHAGESSHATSKVYLVMPYFPRGSLLKELEKRQKTRSHHSEAFVIATFRKICEGVNAIHSLRPEALAHRDLKPGNIMFDHNFTPIIIDFGSADKAVVNISTGRQARMLEDSAAEKCTMPYRAPELFMSDLSPVIDQQSAGMRILPLIAANATLSPRRTTASKGDSKKHMSDLSPVIDQRTDVWSLGCILYAMCFFESPFDAVVRRGDSVALAVMSGRILIPADSVYSKEVHDLILWLLKTKPEDRPFVDQLLQAVRRMERRASMPI